MCTGSRIGGVDTAADHLSHAIALEPRFWPALVEKARLWAAVGDWEQVRQDCSRAIPYVRSDAHRTPAPNAAAETAYRKRELRELSTNLGGGRCGCHALEHSSGSAFEVKEPAPLSPNLSDRPPPGPPVFHHRAQAEDAISRVLAMDDENLPALMLHALQGLTQAGQARRVCRVYRCRSSGVVLPRCSSAWCWWALARLPRYPAGRDPGRSLLVVLIFLAASCQGFVFTTALCCRVLGSLIRTRGNVPLTVELGKNVPEATKDASFRVVPSSRAD